MNLLQRSLQDPKVLLRLNAFFLSSFGWIAFGVLYGIIGLWSVDLTPQFLKLPLTSRDLVVGLVEFIKGVPPIHTFFTVVYYLGFAGSIALMIAYLLLYMRDLEASDRLLARYLLAYAVAGLVYLIAHIHAPHIVYNLPGYTSSNTLLTRQEFVLPSLHNTFIMINIITLWKYRNRLGGKVLILTNSLISFATVFLGHHWIYDVIVGFFLGIAVSKVSWEWSTMISEVVYKWEVSSLQRITVFNLFLVVIVLIVATDPARVLAIFRGLLGAP
ncbi:MAG TPA: phosphatase PAP2 family protein [Thermococcaceae archaeon]|uniref:Membrane-bound phosphoesterase, PAP2 superfamily n=2 Tax=Thermococcus sibiricus TaxID=172049 RepID=C6A0H6_THESM|nr:phosphatase PAP2 family protein [Thermococcus sibiricus]ACS89121.1 Membrane-bound phosphoesterase, PAP2 superfamily [Thermococcus sibiricus MM 739]KUK18093.1 MAG: Membrane-bound phosphoesterase, PAP2 superfamily [Thermococcus sibiricus]KUK27843.1 MAG: Membrane-bound phosphoesterase, PAP2 superfamily [Thermococcus sp. 40_45]HII67504.1 phosphatase PAP2 family protein [Thermococcaceae archaeon]